MKFFVTIFTVAIIAIAGSSSMCAQLLFNNGASITVGESALVVVNGDTKQNGGEIRAHNNSKLYFNGSVDIRAGGIYLLRDSYAKITKDLAIASGAECWRYAPGSLDVEGSIFNDGDLVNEGEINYGKP